MELTTGGGGWSKSSDTYQYQPSNHNHNHNFQFNSADYTVYYTTNDDQTKIWEAIKLITKILDENLNLSLKNDSNFKKLCKLIYYDYWSNWHIHSNKFVDSEECKEMDMSLIEKYLVKDHLEKEQELFEI